MRSGRAATRAARVVRSLRMASPVLHGRGLSRHYAAVCDLDAFSDPEIARVMPEIAPEADPTRPHRKYWEFAIAALFLRDTGHLAGDAEILDVGAGTDPILYWLAARARRVVAIDIYGRGDFSYREAAGSMLADPAAFAPYAYPQERLEALDMDARRLDFPDESFDAVVSLLIHRALRLASRTSPVRQPRSAACCARAGTPSSSPRCSSATPPSTERPCWQRSRALTLGRRCSQATLRTRGIGEVFTAHELRSRIMRPSGLNLMQPLRLDQSPGSQENPFSLRPDGSATSRSGRPYPHLVVRANRSLFTSIAMPLVKPSRAQRSRGDMKRGSLALSAPT